MSRCLGLDLSLSDSGWCLFNDVYAGRTSYGHKEFPAPKKGRKTIPDEPDRRLHDMMKWLTFLIHDKKPDRIAYEEPAGQNLKVLHGVRGIMYAVAGDIPFYWLYPTSLKKYAGSGKFDKDDMREALFMKTGIRIENDNEVDAYFLALWGSEQ